MGKSGKPGAVPGQCRFFYLISHLKIPSHIHSICPAKAPQRILSSIIVSGKASRSRSLPHTRWFTQHWRRFPSCIWRKRERGATKSILMTAVGCGLKMPGNIILPMLLHTYSKADAVGTSWLIIHVLSLMSRLIWPSTLDQVSCYLSLLYYPWKALCSLKG